MQKLLVICGPTATGKTDLGIYLAKKFNGEIISADSRQVYRDMDIGTGKDIPSDSKFEITDNKIGYYSLDGIRIYGYDLVGPKEEFSVSKYLKFADKAIKNILKHGKLPILVGGTGLYIKGVVDGIPTAEVPLNIESRKNLEKLSVDELFEHLSLIDSFKAGSMNSSDKRNPRRLIRAIEVATWMIDNSGKGMSVVKNTYDVLFVGLTAPKLLLERKINNRVEKRITLGFKEEIEKLVKLGVDWNDQSMMSLGYRQWRDYAEGAVDLETVIAEWKKEERKYSKRQMVWFKKDKRINWFNISDVDYIKKVENIVKLWHNRLLAGSQDD